MYEFKAVELCAQFLSLFPYENTLTSREGPVVAVPPPPAPMKKFKAVRWKSHVLEHVQANVYVSFVCVLCLCMVDLCMLKHTFHLRLFYPWALDLCSIIYGMRFLWRILSIMALLCMLPCICAEHTNNTVSSTHTECSKCGYGAR